MTFTEQPMVAACDQTGIAFMIIQSELCSAAVWGPESTGFCRDTVRIKAFSIKPTNFPGIQSES